MLVVLLVIWEVGVRVLGIRSFLLPRPTAVLASLRQRAGLLFPSYLRRRCTRPLSVSAARRRASASSSPSAWSIRASSSRRSTPSLVALYSVPKVALAPLFIIWLGHRAEAESPSRCFVGAVSHRHEFGAGAALGRARHARPRPSLRASGPQILWKIRFPNSLPTIFAGLKVGISMAFIGAMVGEIRRRPDGLGYLIVSSQSSFDTTQMFAAILLLAVLGLALFLT